MRTPMRPLPDDVTRWTSWSHSLRWLDALTACLVLAAGWRVWQPGLSIAELGMLAATLTVLAALVPGIRVRWRPISGWLGLSLSSDLRPGDRAWYVRPGHAEPVLVTARHGVRLVIARPDQDAAEGLHVRRTRVLLLPMEPASSRRSSPRR